MNDNTLETFIESFMPVPYPSYNEGLLPDEDGYDVVQERQNSLHRIRIAQTKAQVGKLVDTVIGQNDIQNWDDESGFCVTCNAFLEDDDYRCYCDIRNSLRSAQKQRARKYGLEIE